MCPYILVPTNSCPVVPDLTTESNVTALGRWEGSWASLNNISWVRVAADSTVKSSSFPPT